MNMQIISDIHTLVLQRRFLNASARRAAASKVDSPDIQTHMFSSLALVMTASSIMTFSVRTTQGHPARDATAITLILFKMVNQHVSPSSRDIAQLNISQQYPRDTGRF